MDKIILIDALHVNNGGGKVLLDYLIESIEKSSLQVFYLLDDRVENRLPFIKLNKVLFLKANLKNRFLFYIKNKSRFNKILCFGNIPPPIKINANVFTYFQQRMFIDVPDSYSFFEKLDLKLKAIIIRLYVKNSNYWLVQNERIGNALSKKYSIDQNKIDVVPFYPLIRATSIKKNKNTYLYVSNAPTHKNHKILIHAFCKFYDKHNKGTLILTVDESYNDVYELIEKNIKKGYPIENLGFISQNELAEIYGKSRFFIFPSLSESFGLGLVEAIANDCYIIGADLPYTYTVCKPSLVFDPINTKSIIDALEKSLNEDIKKSKSLVDNEITKLINYLK